ncbi:MAG: hypothetical protein NZ601_00440, partial [candidate division WOR-3 bacterium]|nr:hypothetical protein [candidate division WOR-3 bacterium]MDW7988347.1 hypothetical protein [candidate division WOR-3 bacterium]
IKYNTPEHSVVISRKPEFVYLISGRKSFCYPFSTDENKFFEMVNKYRPKYLIYDDFTNTNTLYLLPIITRYPQKFKVIFITKPPEVFLLELDDSLFSRRF